MIEPRCYKCLKNAVDDNVMLLSVYAPGSYFICPSCIEKEENKC